MVKQFTISKEPPRNKLDLIETFKTETGLSRRESAAFADLFFDEMVESLSSGDRVEIRGLWSFFVNQIHLQIECYQLVF
jgi:nucleoid DNA-binding protein